MPQILRQVVFGAAGSNANIWSGSAFEYVRQNAVLSMACAQTVAANFITVNVGSDVIAEEHEPHVIAAASVYPIIPDHFYYQDVAAAMDRLVMSLRATVAVTFKAVALITGI